MTGDKGKKFARALPENILDDTVSPDDGGAADARLDNVSQKRIGDQLRAMYDDLIQQPVPDRFRDLLAQIDNKVPRPK